MKLEDQFCNVELSKQLKELEVSQESEYYWHKYSLADKPELYNLGWAKRAGLEVAVLSGSIEYEYSAFSVAELGEMLPEDIASESNFNEEGEWGCYQTVVEDETSDWIRFTAVTEADARAKMLIYIIKNKLAEMKQ